MYNNQPVTRGSSITALVIRVVFGSLISLLGLFFLIPAFLGGIMAGDAPSITGYVAQIDGVEGGECQAHIAYSSPDGTAKTKTVERRYATHCPGIGSSVTLQYNPTTPKNQAPDDGNIIILDRLPDNTLYWFGAAVLYLGLYMVVIGAYKLYKAVREDKHADRDSDGLYGDLLPAGKAQLTLIENGFRSIGYFYYADKAQLNKAQARELLDEIYDQQDAYEKRPITPKTVRPPKLSQAIMSHLTPALYNNSLIALAVSLIIVVGITISIATTSSIDQSTLGLALLAVTLIAAPLVLRRHIRLSDIDGDGRAEDMLPATAEQIILAENGHRLLGEHYQAPAKINQAEIRTELRNINNRLRTQ